MNNNSRIVVDLASALKVLREIEDMFTDENEEETGFKLDFFEGCVTDSDVDEMLAMREASWAVGDAADKITHLIQILLDGEYCG